MRTPKGIAAAFLCAALLSAPAAADQSRFEIGSPGYLMKACADALEGKDSFRAGYCVGVYSTAHASRLARFGVFGSEYCPRQVKADVNIGLVIEYIKSNPKTWHTGDDYYSVELALKEAWPCNE